MIHNIGAVLYIVSLIVLSLEMLNLSSELKEKSKVAAEKGLKEFINASGHDALDSFSKWFLLAFILSAVSGVLIGSIWQNSIVSSTLVVIAIAFILVFASINAWRNNLKLMGHDLIEKVVASAKSNLSFFLWFTTASFSLLIFLAAIMEIYFPLERELEIEKLGFIVIAMSITTSFFLFIFEVSFFALIQALLLAPALTILVYFYSVVNFVKLLKRIGTVKLKNAFVIYSLVFTIYLIPWH